MATRRQFLQGVAALTGVAFLPIPDGFTALGDHEDFWSNRSTAVHDGMPTTVALKIDNEWYPVKEANLVVCNSFTSDPVIEMSFTCNAGIFDLYKKSFYDMPPIRLYVPDMGEFQFDKCVLDLRDLLLTSDDMEFSGTVSACALTMVTNE